MRKKIHTNRTVLAGNQEKKEEARSVVSGSVVLAPEQLSNAMSLLIRGATEDSLFLFAEP